MGSTGDRTPPTYVEGFHDEIMQSAGMKYNILGNTDMMVSSLSFGSAQLGLVYNTVNEREAILTVRQALKSGINFIDVAPWYGFGTAEILLGKALEDIPRQAYYLSTKVGRYKSNYREMFDFSAQRTLDSVNESLEKLGVDYVDIIQVHDLEFAPSLDIILNETLPALQKIKEQGKARYIGITGYPLEKLYSVVKQSIVPIDTVLSYCRCTLFDESLLEYVPYFKEKGIGVINGAFLGMGLLSSRILPEWHPAQEEVRQACLKAMDYCESCNVSLSKLATRFALSQKGISTHLVGMASLEILQKNLDALNVKLTPQEESVLHHIQERFFNPLKQPHWENVEVEKYWRKIKALNQKC